MFASRDNREGGNLFAKWNGKQWQATGAPTAHYWARLVQDGGNLWLVGPQGLLWRHVGGGWQPTPTGTKATIWSVASAGDEVWIAPDESPLPARLPPLPPPKPKQ
jgi:hypothetical protein